MRGMASEKAIKNFQNEIIAASTAKLGRPLAAREMQFIMARGGFIALELIKETVDAASVGDVERYLNTEAAPDPGGG